jgi:hypothetical protein
MTKIVKSIYKVIFLNQGKIYELYARSIYQSELYGFVEVEELIFGEQTTLLVNPAEERLQGEFAGVRRSFVPIHSIIRIDEVEKEGISRVRATGSPADNIATFPGLSFSPGGNRKE